MCIDVGIRICNNKELDLMVDDIAGVSSNLVSSLRENDYQKFSDFFEQLKTSSYKTFLKDLELELLKRKKFNHIVSETKPYNGQKVSEVFKVTELTGYSIELPYHQFTEYHSRSIDIFAQIGGSLEIHIIDMIHGGSVFAKKYEVRRGRNTLTIDKKILSTETTSIFIGIKSDNVSFHSVSCSEYNNGCDIVCSCHNGYGKLLNDSCVVCDIDLELAFCLNSAIRCNLESLVCEYKEFFGEARKHRLGIDILTEKLHSDTRGWFIESNYEIIREYTIPMLKEDYYKHMNLAISNVSDLLNDNICWSCDPINSLVPLSASLV